MNYQYRALNVFAFWGLEVILFVYAESNDHFSFKLEYDLKRTWSQHICRDVDGDKESLVEQLLNTKFRKDQRIMLINH